MRFKDKAWAYKDINNENNSNEIASNLRKTISTSVSVIFTQKIEETCIHTKYGELTNIIHKLNLTMFKNDIMRKLEHLFRL
jgi:predicted nucleic acid-binding protein